MAGAVGFAEGGKGVGGFARLRDDQDARVAGGLFGLVGVLAGVFNVDGNAAEVFDGELGDHARVTAGTAGGDQDFTAGGVQPGSNRSDDVGAKAVRTDITVEGGGQGGGLLMDFAEHPVRVRCGVRGGSQERRPFMDCSRRYDQDTLRCVGCKTRGCS